MGSIEDDFDSSDIEFEARPTKFPNLGQKSIRAIVDQAVEDRITSKRVSKTLTHAEASPKTEYRTQLWSNRFMAFREHTLKAGVDSTPTGLDIERFLTSMLNKVTPRGSSKVPSLSWITTGFERVAARSTFMYPKFRLSSHDRSRLTSLFNQFLQDGLITRQASRESQWVGAFLVRRLVTAHFTKALEQGTTNWDKTIQKALSIVLVAALCCRGGDIMMTNGETHDLPFLCYDDITIKLVGGQTLEHLVAEVVIRNEKGKKFDPQDNRKVRLAVLPSEADNVICPIKMLLISAFRLGALQGSMKQVLATTALRRDKTVQWADGRGRSPVLCGFGTAEHVVLIDRPGMTDQLRDTFYHAGLVAGFLKPLRPHDARRGSAFDLANLRPDPNAATGIATPIVAAGLGHGDGTLRDGITDSYVGGTTVDFWTKRVHANLDDPFRSGVTNNVYQKPRIAREDWLKEYAEAGIDSKDAKAIRNHRDAVHKRHEQEWRLLVKDETSESAHVSKKTAKTKSKKRKAAEALPGDGQHEDSDTADEDDAAKYVTDPDLRGSAANLTRAITQVPNDDEGTAEEGDEIEGMILESLDAPLRTSAVLLVPGLDFVDRLSQINVVSNKRTASRKSKDIPDAYRGNGKDEPTLFQHRCRQVEKCTYLTDNWSALIIHEGRCTPENVEKAAAAKLYDCPVGDCSKSFKDETALKRHRGSIHDFEPQPCKQPGCSPDVLYATNKALHKHKVDVHSPWTPKGCPVEDCSKATHLFASQQSLKTHLQTMHHITDKEELKKLTVKVLHCLYPDCEESDNEFRQKRHLVGHLKRAHKVGKDELESYIG